MSRVFLGFNNRAKASERTGIATTLTHISGHFFPHRVGHPASLPGHGFFERRLVEPGSERVTPDRVLLAVAAGFLGFVAAQHREHVQALEFASDSVPRFRYSPADVGGSGAGVRGEVEKDVPAQRGDAVAGATKGQPIPPPGSANGHRTAQDLHELLCKPRRAPGHGHEQDVASVVPFNGRARQGDEVSRVQQSVDLIFVELVLHRAMWPTRPPTG